MTNRKYAHDDALDFTTWDGEPVGSISPHGAIVVCVRSATPGSELLILHRAHTGIDYEGNWAWTPPSGARRPGESVSECARRELREEVGLAITPRPVDVDRDWAIFVVEVPHPVEIILDAEHDRYEWVHPEEAIQRCQPAEVAESIRFAITRIGDPT